MPDLYEKIDAFLNGTLPDDEKEAMEEAIVKDPGLQKAIIHRKAFSDAIGLLIEEDLKQQFNKRPAGIRPIYKRLSVAASVLILVLAGTYWWAATQLSNQQILTYSYLNANLPVERSEMTPTEADKAFLRAISAFKNGEEAEAIRQFQVLRTDSTYSVDAGYFLAHIYFRRGDYDEAASYFSSLSGRTGLPGYISPEEARANYLLARFGEGSLPADSLQQLAELLGQIEPEKAKKLNQRLHHPLGRLFY